MAGSGEGLYQATSNGLTVYHPSHDQMNTVPPNVILHKSYFKQDNFGRNEVSFRYHALSFANASSFFMSSGVYTSAGRTGQTSRTRGQGLRRRARA